MIILSVAMNVRSVLGSTETVPYDKMILDNIRLGTVTQTAFATVRLTCSTLPAQQPIDGNLTINASEFWLELQIIQLDFFRRITITTGQATTLLNMIRDCQNDIESGLITLGVVAGLQSTGV